MITDRAYSDLSPATRIAAYLKAAGITVVRDAHGTICVRPVLGQALDMAVMEAIAAYGPEIVALLSEVGT